jgi:hypothetical protein
MEFESIKMSELVRMFTGHRSSQMNLTTTVFDGFIIFVNNKKAIAEYFTEFEPTSRSESKSYFPQ